MDNRREEQKENFKVKEFRNFVRFSGLFQKLETIDEVVQMKHNISMVSLALFSINAASA